MNFSASTYFQCIATVTAFRVFMYIFFKEHVTKVKMSKAAWEDVGCREIMDMLTTVIRQFQFFRLMVVIWGSTLDDGSKKDKLVFINIVIDLAMMYLLSGFHVKIWNIKRKVMIHQNRIPPIILQSACLLSGVAFLLSSFVF